MDVDDSFPAGSAIGASVSVKSEPSAAVLPATLAVLVSADAASSSRVISAAFVDSTTHRMAVGHYFEAVGGSVAAESASPLRLLLEQFAPALVAAGGEAVLYVDEKKVVSTERMRLNAQMADLSQALPELQLRSGLLKELPAAGKHIDEVKIALKSALKGGLSSHFVVVDQHTPTPIKAKQDASLGCLYLLLQRYGMAAGGKGEAAGQWELADIPLGVVTANGAAAEHAAPIYMRLDAPAQQALNLFRAVDERSGNSNLFDLLSRGRTKMSARLLETWIRQPLTSLSDIERRHNYVELLVNDSDLRQQLYDEHFKKVPDLDKVIKKLQDVSTRPVPTIIQDVLAIYDLLDRLPSIISTLKAHEGPHAEVLQREFIATLENSILKETRAFQDMVETTIDLEATKRHDYRVKTSVSHELRVLWEKVEDCEAAVDDLVQEAANALGLDKVKKIDLPMHGWVLRVTRKDEKSLRDVKGYSTLETRKDGVYFTNKSLRERGSELKAALKAYDAESQNVIDELLRVTASYMDLFIALNSLLTELDCYLALAHVAANAPTPWVRPQMLPMGSDTLKMDAARHPCLEAINSATFIPNDVDMIKTQSNVQIITGPNMGGKSTYIRQAGVILVMAQLGSFVPCTSAQLTVVDAVLARVGAGDMMQKGISTFASEMLEAASIVKLATPHSLVIIDELGRGTSTYGFGLAWAITEHLATRTQCFTFFATHFAELTLLKSEHACVRNLFVKAHTDVDSITMMYQVEQGVSDRSFGVHVAKVANFPPAVVEMARQKARELEAMGALSGNVLSSGGASADGPSSSQPDPDTIVSASSKRVSASGAGAVPVPEQLGRLLLERPASDFQDHAGTINEQALEQWVAQLQAQCKQPPQHEAAPMDL